jgi:serine phosphatase RsbU (regulator of sigma subunit)
MTAFEQLSLKLSSVKEEGPELLEFYILMWETSMMLNADQYHELMARLKKTHKDSVRVKSMDLLSDGLFYTFHPSYGNALTALSEAEELFRKINAQSGEGAAQSLLALIFKNNGQLDKAQEYVQTAIRNIGEDKTYLQFLCVAYYQAGEMYLLQRDHDSAIRFFTEGLSRSREGSGICLRLMAALGSVYKDTGNLDEAFEMFQKTLKQLQGKNNNILESKIYADIGNYYFRKGDFEEAIAHQRKSIAIRDQHGMKNPLITNYMELAELYLKQNKAKEALEHALIAEKLAVEQHVVIKLNAVYLIISSIYEFTGNTVLALDYYKKHHQAKEEVFSQESARKIKQLTMQHEMESMEKEKELFKLRNVVLKEAIEEIEASVRYAQRIQQAILPPIELIQAKLPESFVLYKPKDIVAGDFYWMEEMGDTLFIAAADCTGHGVPGALVSVVCSNALNRALREFDLDETGKILDKTCELVVETFIKSNQDVKDGMDISLLSIHQKTGQVKWSGANNSLWYVDGKVLKETRAHKKPIGKSDSLHPFTTHTIPCGPDTMFYLCTDGYADQFGGEQGKKFMSKNLKQFFSNHSHLPMKEQRDLLEKTFDTWKGDLVQVDDVTVVGIRL